MGIGTTSPAEKLEVNGNIMVRGGISIYNNTNSYTDTPENQISLDCNGNSGKSGIVWKPEYSDSTTTYTKTAAGIYFVPGLGHFRGGLSFFTNNTESRSTNALERMRIDHDGNVGIGKLVPGELLHISRALSDNFIRIDAGKTNQYDSGIKLYEYDTIYGFRMYYNAQSDKLHIAADTQTTSSNKVTVLHGGDVGIGTDSPGAKLEVKAGINDGIILRNVNNQTGRLINSGGGHGLLTLNHSSGLQNVQIHSYGDTYFNGGNVGIGTTIEKPPAYKLDVRGNGRLGDGLTTEQDLVFDSKDGEWQIGTNNSGNGTNNNQFYFYESSNYRLTIQKGTGNVGIGKTSPTYDLDVVGNINFTGNLTQRGDPYPAAGGGGVWKENGADVLL